MSAPQYRYVRRGDSRIETPATRIARSALAPDRRIPRRRGGPRYRGIPLRGRAPRDVEKFFAAAPLADSDVEPMPGVLRDAAGGRVVGLPDVRLHSADPGVVESRRGVHAARPRAPGAVRRGPGIPRPPERVDAVRPGGAHDHELSAPRCGHVLPRNGAHGRRGATSPGRAVPRPRLEEVVELQVLDAVVREQGRDGVLDEDDPLPQVVRHLVFAADPLLQLYVLLHL